MPEPVKEFETLNHPELDMDGVQRYAVYETWADPKEQGGRGYKLVADNLTNAEAAAFIKARGVYHA